MKKKQKVVFLINQISDGGAETLVKDYALNLNKDDFDIFIVTDTISDNTSANFRFLQEKNITIYCPFASYSRNFICRFHYRIRNLFLRLFFSKKIQKFQFQYIKHTLFKIRPDIIHAHLFVLKYIPPCLPVLHNTKIFYTCHSIPQRYFNNLDCKDNFQVAKFLCEKTSLTFIGLHEEMRIELDKMLNTKKSITLHNGIDLNRFHTYLKNNLHTNIRAHLNIPADAFVVGHIGRFFWIKNQSFILDIFRNILKYNPKAHLLLIGNGDLHEITSKLNYYNLNNKCSILSNRMDIPELLHCMDVFLFPSYLEGFPLACIEAQAMGLRCLISKNVTKEVFFSSKALPMDIEDPAEKWAKAALDKNIQGPYIGNIEEYDINIVLKKLSALYKSE